MAEHKRKDNSKKHPNEREKNDARKRKNRLKQRWVWDAPFSPNDQENLYRPGHWERVA